MIKRFNFLLPILSFVFLFVFASPALAADFGTFTASNVQYDSSTNQLSFTASNFSQPVTTANMIGITSCNTAGCSVGNTEYYAVFDQTSISDPYDFNATLSFGAYVPTCGSTVYVEFSDSGFSYQRMWSQAFNFSDIATSCGGGGGGNIGEFGNFTASNVHYNPTTQELSFHASGFSQPVTSANMIGITSCNVGGCSVGSTEFYAVFDPLTITDPYDFNATLSLGNYTPTCGTVYVEFSDSGATYQRMWSQPLNYSDITGSPCVSEFGTFTASNVHYNPVTHELSFTASNFSQPVTQASNIGITNCNTPGCSVENTEFWGGFDMTAITDPYDFSATLINNSYRPSSGTVYVEFSDAGATYQRMWSQALNYDDIVVNTNNPPSVGTVAISPNPVTVNTPVFASVGFFDVDTLDTHTATIDWGDGSGQQYPCDVNQATDTVSCSKPSGYAIANVYPVVITVSDGISTPVTSLVQYASVYAPTQSSIFSAGQRFVSPAGAYIANPDLTGNVIFGLNYKFNGTMTTEIRQFSMDFNQANFHFNATNVNALVINNGMATLTGTGTGIINNVSGTYSFLVTGVDGGGIRIKITDQSNNVVYDTQPGALDSATPSTSVNGQVIVH